MSDKKDMSDMTASEISYRKFLKNLGVTTHKEIEKLINKKIADGELRPNANLDITANIKIDLVWVITTSFIADVIFFFHQKMV